MCGIAGVAQRGRSDYAIKPELLAAMAASIAHRGPDGQGVWLDARSRVGLSHRRLAIVDLTPAAGQPMQSADGSLVLVFNGEIYNHREIRAELEREAGLAWSTDHSDTEVLLNAFRVWGIGCLERLQGMFAFAVWDDKAQQLWLVRDRVGVKPLYYSLHGDRLTFASEIKALLVDPDQRRAIDPEALFHSLSFLTAPAPLTMFAGISKLPPGTWMRLDADGTTTSATWWDPWDGVVAQPGITEADAAVLVRDEFERAVSLRKMADVPVGIFLSGGVDSSSNAMFFAHGETEPVRTFSVGYPPDALSTPSELPYARRVAELIGADQHEITLDTGDLIDLLPDLARMQDEPIADPVCFPLYYLGRLARQNTTPVVQVGEGADELFAGYPRWHRMLQLQRLSRYVPGGTVGRSALRLGRSLLGPDSFRHEYARRAVAGVPVFWGGAEGFGEDQKRRLLGPELRSRFADTSSWEVLAPVRAAFEHKAWDQSDLSWMTYLDLRLRLPELLLMRVDKMTMASGIEARVPFLDPLLIRSVLGLPVALRIGTEPKGLLKTAVRGLVPDFVLDRPKQGFGVPLEDWFAGELGHRISQTLTSFSDESGLLDRHEVQRLLAGPRRHQAWYLFNLALWWETVG